MPATDRAWVEIGAVVGAHGLRGELRVKRLNPASDTLRNSKSVSLRKAGQSELVTKKVVSCRPNKELDLVVFEGILDRSEADLWKGATVLVERDALPPLDEDEIYVQDLIGCTVFEDETMLGHVARVDSYATADMLVVVDQSGKARFEIPNLDAFVVAYDKSERRIDVRHSEDFVLAGPKVDRDESAELDDVGEQDLERDDKIDDSDDGEA